MNKVQYHRVRPCEISWKYRGEWWTGCEGPRRAEKIFTCTKRGIVYFLAWLPVRTVRERDIDQPLMLPLRGTLTIVFRIQRQVCTQAAFAVCTAGGVVGYILSYDKIIRGIPAVVRERHRLLDTFSWTTILDGDKMLLGASREEDAK